MLEMNNLSQYSVFVLKDLVDQLSTISRNLEKQLETKVIDIIENKV